MKLSWDDLRVFLDVARLGGLTAASQTTGLSAATLGRRMTALEGSIGERLFTRMQTGYRLTPHGEELLARAEEVEAAMLSINRWQEGAVGERTVRVSAGPWTSAFLARQIDRLWTTNDRFGLELVTANQKVDIGRRHADIGIRNQRPSEAYLAGRLIGRVAYALYARPELTGGVSAGYFVGVAGEGAQNHSARWLHTRHADRIVIRGNDAMSVIELVAAGAGISVFPCFVGDEDPRIRRIASPISDLETEQWLVSHQEDRHTSSVRIVIDRIANLMRNEEALFRGERGRVQ